MRGYQFDLSRIILGMDPANERRRYIVTPRLIGGAQTQNDRCLWLDNDYYKYGMSN